MQAGLVEKSYLSLIVFCVKETCFVFILAPLFSAAVQTRAKALYPSIWGHQFGEPGLFPASKLAGV